MALKAYPLAQDLLRPVLRVAMPRAMRVHALPHFVRNLSTGGTMHVVTRRFAEDSTAPPCRRLLIRQPMPATSAGNRGRAQVGQVVLVPTPERITYYAWPGPPLQARVLCRPEPSGVTGLYSLSIYRWASHQSENHAKNHLHSLLSITPLLGR